MDEEHLYVACRRCGEALPIERYQAATSHPTPERGELDGFVVRHMLGHNIVVGLRASPFVLAVDADVADGKPPMLHQHDGEPIARSTTTRAADPAAGVYPP